MQIEEIQTSINNYRLLQQSIEENTNKFNKDSSFYNQFLDCQLNIKQYQDKINKLQEMTNTSSGSGQNNSSLYDLKQQLEIYKNQFMTNIKTNIEQNKIKLKQLQSGFNNNGILSNDISIEKYKMDSISQIDDTIKSINEKINEVKMNIEAINQNKDNYEIKAPSDGILHMVVNIKEGDLLQSGYQIANILPEENNNYKVYLYISNKDIANVKTGQNVKFQVLAIPYQEYGYINGKIIKLAPDSTLEQKSGQNFYEAEAIIDNKPLYSHKGERVYIKNGMVVNAKIVTPKEKMLYYLLDQLKL
ncbi:MAG: HlyD family efflux transporter periplasmic adaptor subunit [Thermoanaerobacteraceae bacterium]|nr:HlyD family efflux transporter periplasmic adaptor subunit [Thermoanaerobacteraceae bacterium]